MHTAVLHHRVDDRRTLACFRVPDEEPVLLANGAGPDRIFNEVVVDLDHPVARFGIARQFRPEVHGIVHGDGQRAGGQELATGAVGVEPRLDQGQHGGAALDTQGRASFVVESLLAGLGLDAVEPLDLGDIPRRCRSFAIDRFDELSPSMAPAGETREPRVLRGQGLVGDEAVALQPPGKTL